MKLRLWLRWSLRDLRRRWLQVAAISLIIAIGTGLYASLGSSKQWRLATNDASYEALAAHDLRVTLPEGGAVERGRLLALLGDLAPRTIAGAQERLVVPTQVDASDMAGTTVLVPGRLIGMATSPTVDQLQVTKGRPFASADRGQDVALVENNFSTFYDLPDAGSITIAGDHRLDVVGSAMSPEFFMVTTEGAGFLAEANFAAVFVPLETAQTVTDRAGQVNDLVVRLAPNADVAAAQQAIEAAVAARPGLAATVTPITEDSTYRILYDDPEGDELFSRVFALLILAGATFAAFNLATRMVEAQRREIGVSMALGMSPAAIAVRPLLVGAEIAALGVAFGVGIGLVSTQGLRGVYESFLPMPVWKTELQVAPFVTAAVLGFAVPVIATAWPVWRAVRVSPVDAIRTGHRAAKGGLAPLATRLPLPGGAFGRMPVGNVLRTPRRTFLTALGIGAAITAMMATFGLIDSFLLTVDKGERELVGNNDERVAIELDRFYPVSDPVIASISSSPSVGEIASGLRVGARLTTADRDPFDVIVEVVDLTGPVWQPTASDGDLGAPGIVLSEKAAADLGVGVGDDVDVTRPVSTPEGPVLETSAVPVAALHPNPMRVYAYADDSYATEFLGVGSVANFLQAVPGEGSTTGDVQRELFTKPGVASVQPVATVGRIFRDAMDEFVGLLRGIQLFILLLAFLIAFNASSINADERAREHATLFAFGLPVRRVMRMDVVEAMLIGVLGTALGIAGGLVALRGIATFIVSNTLPDVQLTVDVATGTYVTTIVMGVVAVAVAPLFSFRRLRRMDIPSTLRIVE